MAYLASQLCQLGEEISGSQLFQRLAQQFQLPRLKNDKVDQKDQYCSIRSDFGSVVKSVAVKNDRSPCVNWTERRAAVLICLFEGEEGELRVILTKRSMKLSSYPGDVALPGGKFEKGDADDSATALREAMEEIGLEPNLVRVAATLEPFISQHLHKVVPVVGLLARKGNFRPSLNTDEVDNIFDVPLEMFLKEDNHRCEAKEWMGRKYILHLFDFQCEKGCFLIWGLTASILIRVASIIYQRSPCFEAHLPDFQTIANLLLE
ncbi:nudix hydrolase 15, mitochondrial-like [Juglans microcarpa x Juglans regia]|uniref:nudix hydrolase 15, mitochondrial-like n=1 Tax=Juglans microcarpa x Juglans regia TaxID=2249226 RepID=UPI001B7DE7B0|nr:nudix hydrolase 15, mitochondrial-like [Juglans microcarpa x Juglans regia]